jgi:hypothetical protein
MTNGLNPNAFVIRSDSARARRYATPSNPTDSPGPVRRSRTVRSENFSVSPCLRGKNLRDLRDQHSEPNERETDHRQPRSDRARGAE